MLLHRRSNRLKDLFVSWKRPFAVACVVMHCGLVCLFDLAFTVSSATTSSWRGPLSLSPAGQTVPDSFSCRKVWFWSQLRWWPTLWSGKNIARVVWATDHSTYLGRYRVSVLCNFPHLPREHFSQTDASQVSEKLLIPLTWWRGVILPPLISYEREVRYVLLHNSTYFLRLKARLHWIIRPS